MARTPGAAARRPRSAARTRRHTAPRRSPPRAAIWPGSDGPSGRRRFMIARPCGFGQTARQIAVYLPPSPIVFLRNRSGFPPLWIRARWCLRHHAPAALRAVAVAVVAGPSGGAGGRGSPDGTRGRRRCRHRPFHPPLKLQHKQRRISGDISRPSLKRPFEPRRRTSRKQVWIICRTPFTGFVHSPAFDVRDVAEQERGTRQVDPKFQGSARPVGRDQKPVAAGAVLEPRVAQRNGHAGGGHEGVPRSRRERPGWRCSRLCANEPRRR